MNRSLLKRIVLCIALVLLLASCEIVESNYDTWEEMSQAPANQLSWIPAFMLEEEALVRNIHSISECHDLDSNKIWGKAECNDQALSWLRSLSFQEQQLDNPSLKFLSKLGLKDKQTQVAQIDDWKVILEGSTFYYFAE